MHANLRLAASAALLAVLAGCYGAPVTDQPVGAVTPPVVAAPLTGVAAARAPPPGTAIGTQCYAGAYTCVLPQPGPIGTGCSCPGLGAPSYGTIR
jgi:hypothetical protein